MAEITGEYLGIVHKLTPEWLGTATEAEKEEAYRLLTMPPETRFARDPVGWAVEVLGVPEWTMRWSALPEYRDHVWDGTVDPIAAMMEAVARGEDVAVESATGTGKTFGAAVITLWFPATHLEGRVITVAPKEDLLSKQLWMEMGGHLKRFKARYPSVSTIKLGLRMTDEEGMEERWGAMGWACGVEASEDSATRAQGFHGKNMLVITEETPGVPGPIMTALANTRTGSHNPQLSLGNPDHQQDELHKFALQPTTTLIRISALDHPNVVTGRELIPGACTRTSVTRFTARLGEDTPMWRSRVRGICPDQAVGALIRSEWVERAFLNYDRLEFHVGKLALGVDVAQSETGRDDAAIARGSGAALHEVESFPCDNADVLGERIVMEGQSKGILPKHVGVDAVGIGSNVVNAGKRLGYPMADLQSAGRDEPSKDDLMDMEIGQKPVVGVEQCLNLRSRMYWQLRMDLEQGRLAIKRDDKLKMDLLAVTWEPKNGKIVIKPKALIRKDLGRSTDRGDACVYWNWVRDRKQVVPPETETDAFSGQTMQAMLKVLRTGAGRKTLHRRAYSQTMDEGGY